MRGLKNSDAVARRLLQVADRRAAAADGWVNGAAGPLARRKRQSSKATPSFRALYGT
jgi:hypothetical protein